MDRLKNLEILRNSSRPWDIVIIGGGATGLGAAVDAASRGMRVALFERSDFAKGTSSRSTKLIHGGLRYLQQGNFSLVHDALRERWRLQQNAPHVCYPIEFVVPSYRWGESAYYWTGLKTYDLLAGRYRFGRSRHLSRAETMRRLPTIRAQGLRGGTAYFDAAFDDARLAITLALTADAHGAQLVNYAPVVGFEKDSAETITGVVVRDEETGDTFPVPARAVINATGPFADMIRMLDHQVTKPVLTVSQGAHVVVTASCLPGATALLIPKTEDGRVLFAIPWQGVTLLGTTETLLDRPALEPVAQSQEIDFILRTASTYLDRTLTRADILSVFAGIRPLVQSERTHATAALSRDHQVLVDPTSKLISIVGGKWTTYRQMAEDVVNTAIRIGGLDALASRTADLRLYGYTTIPIGGNLAVYGSDAVRIQQLMKSEPQTAQRVHPSLPLTIAEVVWGCRHEMARTVEDVLARRSRWLIKDVRATIAAAQSVSEIIGQQLPRDAEWVRRQTESFIDLARQVYGEAAIASG